MIGVAGTTATAPRKRKVVNTAGNSAGRSHLTRQAADTISVFEDVFHEHQQPEQWPAGVTTRDRPF
jgi:hypothetical protein